MPELISLDFLLPRTLRVEAKGRGNVEIEAAAMLVAQYVVIKRIDTQCPTSTAKVYLEHVAVR